MTQFTQLFR